MSSDRGRWRGLVDPAIAACLALLLCAVQLPALLARPGRAIWGALDADGLGLIWTLWHGAWQLTHGGGLGLHSELVGFPEGGGIVPADPLEVLALAPATLALGPVVVFNLLQLLHVALAAGVGCWLARTLIADRLASLVVAVALAFSPMLLATAHNGNIDAGQVYLLPLAGGLAWRAARGDGAAAIAAGAVLGLTAVANVYLGTGAALIALALFLARGPVRWGRLTALFGVAVAVALPAVLVFSGQLGQQESLVLKDAMSVARMRELEGAGTLVGLLTPGLQQARLPSGEPGPFLNGFALGWMLLVLALPRLRRPDRLDLASWAMVLGGLLLTLGPRLHVVPTEPGQGPAGLPLPFTLLDHLPPFDAMIELWRFSIVTQLGLALLAARTLAGRRPRWIALAVALVLAEAMFLTPGRSVWRVERLPQEPVAAVLEGLEQGAVLHYPLHQGDWPLYYQTLHRRPVANAPMGKGDPPLVELVGGRAWTLHQLRNLAVERGFRWMLVHTRRLPDRPGRSKKLVEHLEAAGLVFRSEGSLHLVDLHAEGPWPVQVYRPPRGKKRPGSAGQQGIPGSSTMHRETP